MAMKNAKVANPPKVKTVPKKPAAKTDRRPLAMKPPPRQ